MNKKKIIGVMILAFVIISTIIIICLLKLNRPIVYIPAKETITCCEVENMVEFYVVGYDSFEDIIYYEQGTKIFENTKETFEKVAQYLKQNHPDKKLVYINREHQINLSNQKYNFKQILDGYVVEPSYFTVEVRAGYYTKFNEDFLFVEKVCAQPKISIEQIKSYVIDYLCKNSEICENEMKVKIYKCIYNGKEAWKAENNDFLIQFQLVIDAKTGRELYSYKHVSEPIF